MNTLSLEASKKVYEIVGEYETEKCWLTHDDVSRLELSSCIINYLGDLGGVVWSPAPNFAELIRVLPNIGEKKGWPETHFCKGEISACSVTEDIACTYMLASTEPEGMKAVEDYLMKLL